MPSDIPTMTGKVELHDAYTPAKPAKAKGSGFVELLIACGFIRMAFDLMDGFTGTGLNIRGLLWVACFFLAAIACELASRE
jgi:hypothetical protein